MTAALLCDGPECASSVTDPKLAEQWWRLERNGPEVDGPRPSNELAPIITLPVLEIGDAYDEYLDELTEEDMEPSLLHFCSTPCLSAWAASAVEFGRALEG